MSGKVWILVFAVCLGFAVPSHGDFKYAETSQITGGAMAGMMKGLGIFSKSARQATKPMESTIYVKGNHYRRDNADGSYQLIDLGSQQLIDVYPQEQTYSTTTFQQLREAVEKMQQQMKEAQQRESHEKGKNVTMTPKIEINPTGKTQTLMGQNAQEVLMKVGMVFQSTDAQQGPQNATFSMDMDSWVAPSVAGYSEVQDYYKKMAVEVGWSPNATLGSNSQMTQSLVDLYKSGKIPVGMPMLTTASMVMEGQQGAQGAPQQSEQQSSSGSSSSSEITSPGQAAAKALGGMFGGFGHKHKKQSQENAPAAQTQAPPHSLMTVTTQVTSYSTDPVDASLFQIPAGFRRIQSSAERILQGQK